MVLVALVGLGVLLTHDLLPAHLEWVDEARVLHVIDDDLWVFFEEALVFDEICDFDQIHTHINHLLNQFFLPLPEKLISLRLLLPTHRPLRLQLLHNSPLLHRIRRQWINTPPLKIVQQLTRHLFQSLFSQLCRIVPKISVGDELHDIRAHVLFVFH